MFSSHVFEWAFHAAGTWLPIDCLIQNGSGNQNRNVGPTEVEHIVRSHHFKEYKNTKKITPEAVHATIDKTAADKAVTESEECCCVAKQEAHDNAERL